MLHACLRQHTSSWYRTSHAHAHPHTHTLPPQGFDPLNFGGLYNMKYLREAEIKHGRVCMLATFGFVMVDLGLIAPGAPAVSSLAAHDVTVKSGHMLFLLFVVAIWEVRFVAAASSGRARARAPSASLASGSRSRISLTAHSRPRRTLRSRSHTTPSPR